MIRTAATSVAVWLAVVLWAPAATAARPVYVARPGQVVRVVVDGFAPRAVVTELRSDQAAGGPYRADATGRVVLTHRARTAPGTYTLTEVGEPPGTFRRGFPRPRTPRVDDQTLQVVVPRIVVVQVVVLRSAGVPAGAGVLGAGAGAGAGGTVAADAAGAALAATGSDLRLPVLLGLGTVLTGAALLVVGRRRRTAPSR